MRLPQFMERLFQRPPPGLTQAQAEQQHNSRCKRHDYMGTLETLARLTEVAHHELDASLVRLKMIEATARERNEVGDDDRNSPGRVADDSDPA